MVINSTGLSKIFGGSGFDPSELVEGQPRIEVSGCRFKLYQQRNAGGVILFRIIKSINQNDPISMMMSRDQFAVLNFGFRSLVFV